MLERLIRTLRQVTEGLGHPAYGCCSGDPIAWEKDLLRQRAEAAAKKAAHAQARAAADAGSLPPSLAPEAAGSAH